MNNITKYNGKLNILGKTLKEYRLKNGWTLERVSNELMLNGIDVHQSSVQRIEVGERIVKDYELVGFAKIFKVSPNTLLKDFIKELD